MFVRIRLPMGNAYQAVLVAESALGTDQGQKFLYVIGKDDNAERRNVRVGQLHNGLRVITEGLATGEKVVVNGLQRVRNGNPVKATVVEMPGTDEGQK
jgi:multidrug efflux system membrane fusion protein